MKTALMAFVLVLYCCVSYAQPTNEKKDDGICDEDACMGAKFKYRFCTNDGRVVVKCSDDPNNEPGMKLMKRKIPIDYQYQHWTLAPTTTEGDDTISFYEGDLQNFYEYPMFVGANMEYWIRAAAERWMTNLCAPQGPDDEYQNCVVTVRWTRFNEDIGSNFALMKYDIVVGCSVLCPSVELVLNQNENFTRRDDYNRPIKFIATERHNYGHLPRFTPSWEEYVYMDAYTLALHEFGHWLGFPHSNGPDDFGENCGDPNGIMKATAGSLEQQDLSWADQCMFLKAYCCEETQREHPTTYDPRDPNDPPYDGTKRVIAHSAIEGFTILPNPSRSGLLTLRLPLLEESGPGNVRIVDASGRIVLHHHLKRAGGEEVSLDISGLSKGMYMVQVAFDGHIFSRKVVLE